MDLAEYIKKKGIKKGWFASQIPCSACHISQILNGKRIASPLLIYRIEYLTNGEVTKDDFKKREQSKDRKL